MNLSHLKYFSEVYRCLNYSKAAQSLYVSRQTLQQAVRSLEREFGAALFEVGPGGLVPTVYGATLYQGAQKTLESLGELEAAMASLDTELYCPVRQGTITNIHDIMTDKEAQECHRRNFDPRDTHVSSSSDELRRLVREGELDVAYLYGDVVWSEGFTRVVSVEKNPLYLAVPVDHPLATRVSVRVEDLKGEPFLEMGDSYDIDKTLHACCRERGFSPMVTCVSPDARGLLAKVAMGAGLTYRLTDAPWPRVACIPFDEPALAWDNYAIFREGPLEENPAYERFFAREPSRGLPHISPAPLYTNAAT